MKSLLCFLLGVLNLDRKRVTDLKEKEVSGVTTVSLPLSFMRTENWSVP